MFNSLCLKLDAYRSGDTVDRELAEVALDFMVALEPSDDSPRRSLLALREENRPRMDVASAILRAYGEAIVPRTLERMQDEFYSFSNSRKYRARATSISCVRASLNCAWDDIGPWRA